MEERKTSTWTLTQEKETHSGFQISESSKTTICPSANGSFIWSGNSVQSPSFFLSKIILHQRPSSPSFENKGDIYTKTIGLTTSWITIKANRLQCYISGKFNTCTMTNKITLWQVFFKQLFPKFLQNRNNCCC